MGKKPAPKNYMQRQQDAEDEKRESARYQAMMMAVNALRDELKSNRKRDNANQKKQAIIERKKICREKWTIFGLFITATITFGALLATSFQAFIAKDTEKRQLRAYVTLTKIVKEGSTEGVPTVIELIVKNSGQTPAYDVIDRAARKIDDAHSNGLFPIDMTAPASKMTMGADMESHKIFPMNLTQEQIASVNNGTKAIWIYGEVTYKDVFGESHITRYRTIFGGHPITPEDRFSADEEGNCTDGECDKRQR